jgi:hypothetical protein
MTACQRPCRCRFEHCLHVALPEDGEGAQVGNLARHRWLDGGKDPINDTPAVRAASRNRSIVQVHADRNGSQTAAKAFAEIRVVMPERIVHRRPMASEELLPKKPVRRLKPSLRLLPG